MLQMGNRDRPRNIGERYGFFVGFSNLMKVQDATSVKFCARLA